MTRMKRRRREGERGQALVLFVIFLVMILSTLALIINGGMVRRSQTEQRKALDAGALAGAASLPTNPTQARADALRFALLNHPGLTASNVTITFRCIVGDRNNDGQRDAADVPAVCDPGSGALWTCEAGRCVAVCNPFQWGRTCNTVVVNGTVNTDYELDEVTGVEGQTTNLEAAACAGLCGADPAVPLDVGIVLDRTGSMSSGDLTNVKTAAQSMLRLFDPNLQRVGMAVLGPSQTSADCSGTGNPRGLAASSGGTWVVVPYPTNRSLSNDYLRANGTLNTDSQLVRTIQCLNHSRVGTNLGDPLLAMASILRTRGRANVTKGIIFMTDGAANKPNSRSCRYAMDRATAVKNMGIEVYTIGFGVTGDRCIDIDGTYRNALASRLLADMATGPSADNGCNDAENSDGDHYFCEPRSESLNAVFRAAASQLLQGAARLIELPG